MSDAEGIMWAVEKDPALRSDFCNLTVLDRLPDPDRIRATIEHAVAVIPRLGERVVAAPLRLVPPAFAPDPGLELDYHVRRVQVPPPGDLAAVLALAARIAETPFDRSRPLWEFTIFEGMADGRAAFMQKVHHTISDGVGGLKLSLALLDLERDPPRADARPSGAPSSDHADADAVAAGPVPRRDTPLGVTRDAIGDAAVRNVHAIGRLLHGAGDLVIHPLRAPSRAADLARTVVSLQRQGLVTDRARSDVMTERSLRRHFAVLTLPFAAVRDTARELGGSINDVYVTGLAGGLGRYHARSGSDVTELRLAMPVSTRDRGDSAANRFVPARVLVPITPVDDPIAMHGAIHEVLAAVKAEAALHSAESLAGLAAAVPTSILVAFTRNQTATIDFAASNLRGSPVPLYLAGARIEGNYAFGPRTGTPLNVTMMSFCDDLHLGFNIDPAAIADIPAFMSDVEDAFAALLAVTNRR